MSSSSPADLAITFRSIPRRVREAYGDDQPAGDGDLAGQLATAAQLLGTIADPSAIGAAIDAIHPDQWDQDTLEQLRAVALDVGAQLRAIAAAHPRHDD